MNYLVYKITNQTNGKIYIGVHKTFNVDDGYMGSGKLIKAAIKKYGVENFKKEILAQFESADEMFSEEKNLISQMSPEYNIHPGGNVGWGYVNENNIRNFEHLRTQGTKNFAAGNETFKRRMKSDQKFRTAWSDQARNSLAKRRAAGNDPFRGKTHSEETRAIISSKNAISQLGHKNSQFGSMWITDGVKNKKMKKTEPIPDGWKRGRL